MEAIRPPKNSGTNIIEAYQRRDDCDADEDEANSQTRRLMRGLAPRSLGGDRRQRAFQGV